ncbi:MAG: IS3 family transposase, partial [Gammaproteobacteria bacterium]
IRFVTPAQRHRGEDKAILAKRDAVYAAARKANPRRWATITRNWRHIENVALNPDQATRENLDNVA